MNLLSLLPSPYVAMAIAGGIALAGGGGFYAGSQHEHRTHVLREAKAAARIDAARVRLVAALNTVSGDLAAAHQHQDQSFGDIRHDAAPIILRPIYRTVAIDGDGVGLLDRARDAADGGASGEPDDPARAAPDVPAQP